MKSFYAPLACLLLTLCAAFGQDASIQSVKDRAGQGEAQAQYLLALSYATGIDMPQNYAESGKLYRAAALQGHAGAQQFLGSRYYSNSQGKPENLIEAYVWLSLAASQNSPDAIEAAKWRDEVKGRLTKTQIATAQARTAQFVPAITPATKAWQEAQAKARSAPTYEPPQAAARAAREKASGTGFFITEDGYLVTNYHVTEDGTRFEIKTKRGTFPANLVKTDKANDLALLKAAGSFSPLPIGRSGDLKLGASVFTVGFPNPELQGKDPKLTRGDINSLAGLQDDPRYFQISVPIQPGNSGGALADAGGNVIGVVTARLSDVATLRQTGTIPQNVNYALKSSFLKAFLESIPNLPALKGPASSPLPFETVAGQAEAAAALVLVY